MFKKRMRHKKSLRVECRRKPCHLFDDIKSPHVRDLLVRLHANDSRLEDMLPDRWSAAHPEFVLTHRLEESRTNAAAKRDRRRRDVAKRKR